MLLYVQLCMYSILTAIFLLLPQLSYGDHVSSVHHSGFLQGKLEQVLPVSMATSRRRVEFERRVLTQHSRISQDLSDDDSDSQVRSRDSHMIIT